MGKLMAGFLFLFLSFNLNLGESVSINLLPEFVGFLFLCAGFTELCDESPCFMKLRPICVAMAIAHGILWFGNLFGLATYFLSTPIGIVFTIALTIVTYVVTYHVIAGIADIENANAFDIGSNRLKTIWWGLVVTHAVAYVAAIVSWMILMVLTLIVVTILMIGFLIAFHDTKKQYEAMKEIKMKEKLRALDMVQEHTEN